MARIEWVKQRLSNWALWLERRDSGGLGFPSQSSFMREATTPGYREAIIPINDVDASVTNDGVQSLKLGRSHLYDCLQCIYVQDTGIRGAAVALCRAESTVKAQLCAADHALAAWFSERASKKEKSFTP